MFKLELEKKCLNNNKHCYLEMKVFILINSEMNFDLFRRNNIYYSEYILFAMDIIKIISQIKDKKIGSRI